MVAGRAMSAALNLALFSILVSTAVFGLKLLAWWVTGSVALLSDALESIVNLATGIAALIAVRVAAIPADNNHPFGHHKAEYFSAVLEGVMIFIAAFFILREAIGGLFNPHDVQSTGIGLAVNLAATLINALWARVLIQRGRALKSPALAADGHHLMTDVWTSVGVVAGVSGAAITGWWILDPLLALLVALHILASGTRLILTSLNGLMDQSVEDAVLSKIKEAITASSTGALEVHDLKTREAARMTFVEFHLVVPGNMTVFNAHEICDRIEAAVKNAVPDTVVIIHVEPEQKLENDGVFLAES